MGNIVRLFAPCNSVREERIRNESELEDVLSRMGFRMAVVSYVDENGITGSVDFMNVSRPLSQSKV